MRCIAVLGVVLVVFGVMGSASASVSTDRWVYQAGDTVSISGDGMSGGESVGVDIAYPDGSLAQHHDVTANDDGTFSDSYVVQASDPGGIYSVTATGAMSGNVFETTFDPAVNADCLQFLTGGQNPQKSPVTPELSADSSGVTVSWLDDQCTGPGHYHVLRSTSGAHSTSNDSVDTADHDNTIGPLDTFTDVSGELSPFKGSSPFVDSSAECGTTYYYQIQAHKIEGEGDNAKNIYSYSDIVSTTTDDCNTGLSPLADLAVSKTAAGAYDETYTWGIDKSADKTTVKQIGGSVLVNYTVTVTHDNGTISDVRVTGDIDVSNVSNPDDAVTGVDVTDTLSDGTVCDVTNGTDATIAAGGISEFHYSCDLGDSLPEGSLTNTATATWPTQVGSGTGATLTGNSADSEPVNVTFTATPIDECANVTDTYTFSGGPLPATLCNIDASPTQLTYQRSLAVPANDCVAYDNTASFATNDTGATGSASWTVNVCGPAKTGALTMGFWKNTNGNGLIGQYCGGSSGLAAYLSGLGSGTGPFADAAGKGCNAMVTYVNGIFKAASASNMNAMLKAQMLATALDVYFSGPGWTSTKSGGVKPPSQFLSHNTLGSFSMDTTAVCPMVDNLNNGSATCTGGTPSTDAVAAGAMDVSPKTMQAILDYEASAARFSGGVWYAGNRTKQEIAKNIFDQFNNQLAFAG